MWEHVNALMQYLGMVPAEWFNNLSETQKLTMLPNAVSIVLALTCLYLLALLWRDKVPHIQKETAETDKELGEEWHDILVNWVNNQKLDRHQYKKYCRILKTVLPGAQYGGTYSETIRKVFRTRATKSWIAKRINFGFYKPTLGWLQYLKREQQPRLSKFRKNMSKPAL